MNHKYREKANFMQCQQDRDNNENKWKNEAFCNWRRSRFWHDDFEHLTYRCVEILQLLNVETNNDLLHEIKMTKNNRKWKFTEKSQIKIGIFIVKQNNKKNS